LANRVADQLSRESLKSLAEGEVLAISVKSFLSAHECSLLIQSITESRHFRFDGLGFRGLGPGDFQLPDYAREYFETSQEVESILSTAIGALETAVGSLVSPEHFGGPLRRLTARKYDSTFVAPPHQDHQKYPWAKSQLGISLAVLSPQEGGAIRVWDHQFDSLDVYLQNSTDGHHLDESLLPPHDLQIRGGEGELLIINARKIHAIDRITLGNRISISGFLTGHNGDCLIWS
jgi:hypothetical protein